MTIAIKKEIFSSKSPDRGFTIKAFYLQQPNDGDALVEIYREEKPYRRFLYPAYKVWNIAAHFDDIVNGEIEGNFSGYDLAGWTGFGVVPIREIELAEPAPQTGICENSQGHYAATPAPQTAQQIEMPPNRKCKHCGYMHAIGMQCPGANAVFEGPASQKEKP